MTPKQLRDYWRRFHRELFEMAAVEHAALSVIPGLRHAFVFKFNAREESIIREYHILDIFAPNELPPWEAPELEPVDGKRVQYRKKFTLIAHYTHDEGFGFGLSHPIDFSRGVQILDSDGNVELSDRLFRTITAARTARMI